MTSLSARRPIASQLLLFTGLFWLFTYALLSARTQMLLGEAFPLISARRLLGTTAGLAARLAVEHLWYETPLPLPATLRWVMAWSGYFGLWVSASLAFQMHRERRSAAPAAVARPAAAAPALAPPAAEAAEAWDWLVEACAAELAASPAPDRAALAARLVARAGYERADDPDGAANARVELASRLAARLAGPPPERTFGR